VRLVKTCAFSGTIAKPRVMMRLDGRRSMRSPWKRIAPSVIRARPRIAFTNVVLPAALLPRMLTISPCSTSMSTPCRTSSGP
jgi:hypothetical protein